MSGLSFAIILRNFFCSESEISNAFSQSSLRSCCRIDVILVFFIVKKESLIRIEYISIRDKVTFEPVDLVSPSSIILIAVCIGKTRLIDNLTF